MARSTDSGIINFQDHLYKKDFLIEKATLLRMELGDRIFPQALLGKEGWMEYTGAGNIDDFQNLTTFENKEKLKKNLTAFNQFLQSQGITLLIVVAPNKASIYPDKLPEQMESLPTQSRLDKFILYLESNNLPVIDLRPALLAARQDQDVYYKTNTHWNGYGAFAAYTTIINSLESSYPSLKPYKAADLKLVTIDSTVHDIPRLMHATFITEPSLFFKPEEPFVQTLHPGDYYGFNQSSWIPESKLPTLLMFHDSFGFMYLNDYLNMNFAKSYFIDNSSMIEYLTRETIQYFKPDIIIIEIVERHLHLFPEYFSNFATESSKER
jgi:hypothetical protein